MIVVVVVVVVVDVRTFENQVCLAVGMLLAGGDDWVAVTGMAEDFCGRDFLAMDWRSEFFRKRSSGFENFMGFN